MQFPQTPVAGGLMLYRGYPNPFSSQTTIYFTIPAGELLVDLSIYDIRGRKVRTLVHKVKSAGNHKACWDGRDGDRRTVASGVYYCVMEAGGFRGRVAVVLVR